MQCIDRYGTASQFLVIFNPDKQTAYTKDLRRVYLGSAPTINVISEAYGETIAESWLEIQIQNLVEYIGNEDKLPKSRTREMARVILSNWGHFKVSELMLFFLQFKSGKYGVFWEDGIKISKALREFARERMDIISRYQQEEERAQREREREAHMREVQKLNDARRICHMTIQEMNQIQRQHRLTLEELAEVGWLFRI